MNVKVEIKVVLRHPVSLPETAVCRVEVRDVTLLNASAITLKSYEAPIWEISNQTVLTVDFVLPESDTIGRDLNVWAHLSLTGEKQIQAGDYIATRAYPIKSDVSEDFVVVELQPVSPSDH